MQPRFWNHPTLTWQSALLWPLGQLYGLGATLHGKWRAAHAYKAPVPVISVGNLTIGGTGKTPLTALLAQHFSRTHQVAILSRGYGGTITQPTQVLPHHTAAQVGDEPRLLANRLANVQVWVACNRPAAAKAAAANGATLLILDDGYQRQDLHRDVNLLVIGSHGLGNHQPLPAGPLREFPAATSRAHLIVHINPSDSLPPLPQPTFPLTLTSSPETLSQLQGKPIIAFAGLAEPNKFFRELERAGLNLIAKHPFPDHHAYTTTELTALHAEATQKHATLVCTPKDAVKIPHLVPQQIPHASPQSFPCLVVPEILTGPALPNLLQAIESRLP